METAVAPGDITNQLLLAPLVLLDLAHPAAYVVLVVLASGIIAWVAIRLTASTASRTALVLLYVVTTTAVVVGSIGHLSRARAVSTAYIDELYKGSDTPQLWIRGFKIVEGEVIYLLLDESGMKGDARSVRLFAIPYEKKTAKRLRQLKAESAKNKGVPGIVMKLRKRTRRGFNDTDDPTLRYRLKWPSPPPPKQVS